MTAPSSLLDAALRYADLGYPVFPLVPGHKTPMTEHGFKEATVDPTQIEVWWSQQPQANIGIHMEGLLAVDIDGKDNPWPGSPERQLDLSHCPVSLTPSGGTHHVFRQPAGKSWSNTASRLALMVDTRGRGGYIVAPPSVFDGRPYQWVETMPLDVGPTELPEPPSWLIAALDVLSAPAGNGNGSRGAILTDGNPIPSGARHKTLVSLAGTMRRVGMSESEILGALLQVNANRCQPPKSSRDVQKIARSMMSYTPDQIAVALAEGHYYQDQNAALGEGSESYLHDPGILPDELLRIPGFVSEVMDHTLSTAPYPNVAMAFCGALSLQAHLAGRKVRDIGDNRTNLYVLGLAHSSAGKDRPRKVNIEILHSIGQEKSVRGLFASGEGIQDALFIEPATLYQTDEIDAILQGINKNKDGKNEAIMATLLMMYSSANSIFPMRSKAGKEHSGSIDQPCLSVFGTAIPNHYYDALSERMLTNGFFARMLIIECGSRGAGIEPVTIPAPARVLETAAWWSAYRPGTGGNLASQHPIPDLVPQSEGARALLIEARKEAEAEYGKAEAASDAIGTTVWGRVSEHIRKLALVYAISERPGKAEISAAGIAWARALVMHQTRRMLFQAQSRVSSTLFDADCLKCIGKLREAPARQLSHSVLLKRMKLKASEFMSMIGTLEQRGDVVIKTTDTEGKTGRFYSLREGR